MQEQFNVHRATSYQWLHINEYPLIGVKREGKVFVTRDDFEALCLANAKANSEELLIPDGSRLRNTSPNDRLSPDGGILRHKPDSTHIANSEIIEYIYQRTGERLSSAYFKCLRAEGAVEWKKTANRIFYERESINSWFLIEGKEPDRNETKEDKL